MKFARFGTVIGLCTALLACHDNTSRTSYITSSSSDTSAHSSSSSTSSFSSSADANSSQSSSQNSSVPAPIAEIVNVSVIWPEYDEGNMANSQNIEFPVAAYFATYTIDATGRVLSIDHLSDSASAQETWFFVRSQPYSLYTVVGAFLTIGEREKVTVGSTLFDSDLAMLFAPITADTIKIEFSKTTLLSAYLSSRTPEALSYPIDELIAEMDMITHYFGARAGILSDLGYSLSESLAIIRTNLDTMFKALLPLESAVSSVNFLDQTSWLNGTLFSGHETAQITRIVENVDQVRQMFYRWDGNDFQQDSYITSQYTYSGDGIWAPLAHPSLLTLKTVVDANNLQFHRAAQEIHNYERFSSLDIAGMNIVRVLQAMPFSNTRSYQHIDLNATFSAGAVGHVIYVAKPTSGYYLFHTALDFSNQSCSNGITLDAEETNCDRMPTLRYHLTDNRWSSEFATNLDQVISPSSELNRDGLVLVDLIRANSLSQTVYLHLIDDTNKTANFYQPGATPTDAMTLIGSSTWTKETLEGFSGAATEAITIVTPNQGRVGSHYFAAKVFLTPSEGYLRIGHVSSARKVDTTYLLLNDIAGRDLAVATKTTPPFYGHFELGDITLSLDSVYRETAPTQGVNCTPTARTSSIDVRPKFDELGHGYYEVILGDNWNVQANACAHALPDREYIMTISSNGNTLRFTSASGTLEATRRLD